MTTDELIEELAGTKCRCGKPKSEAKTFCRACFGKLPPPMKRALYRRVGQGYEAAYESAAAFLGGAEAVAPTVMWLKPSMMLRRFKDDGVAIEDVGLHHFPIRMEEVALASLVVYVPFEKCDNWKVLKCRQDPADGAPGTGVMNRRRVQQYLEEVQHGS